MTLTSEGLTQHSPMASVERWLEACNHQPFDIEIRPDQTRSRADQRWFVNECGQLSRQHHAIPLLGFPQRCGAGLPHQRLVDVRCILPEPLSDAVLGGSDPQHITIAVHPDVNDLHRSTEKHVSDADDNALTVITQRHAGDGMKLGPINVHQSLIAKLLPSRKPSPPGYSQTSKGSLGTGVGRHAHDLHQNSENRT